MMKNSGESIAILGIGKAVPPYRLEQQDASQRLADALAGNPDAARWAKRLFRNCGVETRYTCEPNLLEPAVNCRYVPGTPAEEIPTTAQRMEMFKVHSVPLAIESAGLALAESGVESSTITHLITVSCTGQFLPGLDTILMQRLGLHPYTQRIPLTFMGCAAGLTALRMARKIVEEDESCNVLIVCVELCTLHIQPSDRREALFATSFFGDGAGACVVGTPKPERGQPIIELGLGRAVIFPDSAEDMVWDVGNYGFDLYLSPQIPELIAKYAPQEMKKLIGDGPLPEIWAIHPGGRGIIDALQKLLHLTDEQTRASRSILRQYGNLSSATILFVMDEIRQERKEQPNGRREGMAVAFGPGLNAELMKLTFMEHGDAGV